ncbi:hypothetical protein niasHT_025181 [Heterodera trifolii]|uniref:Ubiquitin-like domain-containing protein n=1 Tax=Heterodera trifolii TaxID=157864 RepID=A0ABD2JLR2_9BILA
MKNNRFGFSLFSAFGIAASAWLIMAMLLMMPSSSIADENDDQFQMFVKYRGHGKTYTVEVKGTDTVAILKQKIREKIGIVSEQIGTIRHPPYGVLNDQETLNRYGIQKETTIFLF